MFFGMCNSPATFQSMMDMMFEDIIERGCTVIYMDDIMNFSNNLDTLEKLDKDVLQQLQENDLYLKPTKCKFKKTKIEYLGMVITEGKITMDSVKVKGIQDWPAPTTVKEVWSFLGFGNFYRKFINKFSELAAPLNKLLKKDKIFNWTSECQESFDTLKQWFTAEPVLMMPDQSRPFQIEVDTSKYASGAVLTQMDSNSDRHLVAYFLKNFNDTERNYKIYDRELLGVIRGLYTAPHILIGLDQTFIWLEHQQFFKSESDRVWSDSEVSPINYSDSNRIFSLGSDQNPSN